MWLHIGFTSISYILAIKYLYLLCPSLQSLMMEEESPKYWSVSPSHSTPSTKNSSNLFPVTCLFKFPVESTVSVCRDTLVVAYNFTNVQVGYLFRYIQNQFCVNLCLKFTPPCLPKFWMKVVKYMSHFLHLLTRT